MGVLERNEEMHGTIFDLPHVVDQAQAQMRSVGVR